MERPCRGTSLALGTPSAVPRREGVTQSQGPLPPHVLSFSSWRQRWQHHGLWALLPRSGGTARARPLVPQCLPVSTGALTVHLPQVLNHGGVDPGPAAPGRSPAADAGTLWAALPHRGAALPVAVDREPGVVGRGVPIPGRCWAWVSSSCPGVTGGCSDTSLLRTQGLHRP